MKKNIGYCILLFVGICSVYWGCGTKKKGAEAIVIIKTDTISIAELSRISPDTMLTQKKTKQLALRFSLAKSFERQHDTAGLTEVVKDFADQLNRESDVVWSKEQARNLYGAVKKLKEKSGFLASYNEIKTCLDSCTAGIILPADTAGRAIITLDSSFDCSDTSLAEQEKRLAALCTSILGTEQRLSDGIAEFIFSEQYLQKDQGALSDMVSGLVFDSAAVNRKPISPATKAVPDNSKMALKYRSQQSIQETIAQHTLYLESIYKKELKKNPSMEGVIYITFRVAPAGNVVLAKVKSSPITNRDFINPLLDYVTKINFKPIPENVGNMTFDFPFEFRPEM